LTRWLRELGLIWLIALVAIVVTLAVKDRAQAATSERERLRSVLFKRGPVCDKEPPVALSVLKSPEILMIPLGAGYPFHDPVTLLGWGIPTVRMNWYDYTRVGTGVDRMIRATSGRADVSATLSYAAETSDKGSRSGIRIGLVAADNQTLLNFVWVPDGPSSFCPEYVQLPSVGQQPRKVVLEALGLPDRPDPGGERNIWDTIPRFDGRVVDREVTGRMAWANNNIGCPAGTGFSYDRARSLRIAGTPFFLEEAAYLGVGPGQHSVCSGNVVYVYGMQESSGNFYLTISKRSLGDLRRIWAANIKVEKGDPALKERHTRIVSIAEAGELLHIRTRHYEHDQVLTIEAPLPRVESR